MAIRNAHGMVDWETAAKISEKEFGVQVDWEERFYICVECEEPIYEVDYPEMNAVENEDGTVQFMCPVCEEVL